METNLNIKSESMLNKLNFRSMKKVILGLIATVFISVSSFGQKTQITPTLIGSIHNKALDNIFKNESSFNFNSTEEEFKLQIINHNNTFLKEKIEMLDINPNSTIITQNYNIEKCLSLLNTDKLLSVNFGKSQKQKGKYLEESNIFDKIDFLFDSKVILDTDKTTLYKIFQDYKDNYQGRLSEEELLNKVNNIKSEYYRTNSDYSKTNILVTLTIMETCSNSLEWFDENYYSNPIYTTNAVPVAVVGADAVGVVIGIAEGIVQSGIQNGTNVPVDGASVVTGALISGVTSSIGAGIKALSWLTKLF